MARNMDKEFYDFVPSVVAIMERPPSRLVRLISWLILLFCAIAFTWLYLAKVDIVVSAQGKIVPSGKIKVIQAVDEGVVREIHVKDGQVVKEGDALIELDSTSSGTDEQQLQINLAQAQLKVQRLKTELGEENIILGENIEVAAAVVRTEAALMASNQASFAEQVKLLEYELSQTVSGLESAKSELNKLKKSISHLSNRYSQKKKQAALGLLPKDEVNDALFELQSAQADLNTTKQSIIEHESKSFAALEKIQAVEVERRSELYKELAEAEHELKSVQQELVKAHEKLSHQTLTAPVDGVIQQLALNTIGGVVTKAQDLMVIIPEDQTMELDAQILNKDIGFISADQGVKIKVDAFEFTRYGTLNGDIEWIGSDAVVDEEKGPIYPARIAFKETVLPNVVNERVATVLPGMNATVDIVIGQRRLIEYFLGPILRYKDESLTER